MTWISVSQTAPLFNGSNARLITLATFIKVHMWQRVWRHMTWCLTAATGYRTPAWCFLIRNVQTSTIPPTATDWSRREFQSDRLMSVSLIAEWCAIVSSIFIAILVIRREPSSCRSGSIKPLVMCAFALCQRMPASKNWSLTSSAAGTADDCSIIATISRNNPPYKYFRRHYQIKTENLSFSISF